ncbi:MAG: Gfo/Idh/MocA family oxidoreductase [Pseudomonadota bacterium]
MAKKYGLIGAGMMGAEHIRNIALLDGASIATIYDPVAEQAHHGASLAGGARIATSLEDLAGQPDLDALIIASPNHLHVDQLEKIASLRSIPILCEKPLFTEPADVERIRRLQAFYAAPIWVAMEYRYMPPIARFLEEVDEVTGGIKMLSLQEHRFPFLDKIGHWNRFNRYTGGTFVEKCCHFFDLMRLILRSEPVSVSATAGQMTNHLDEDYGGERSDIWDGGFIIFDFENGTRALLELAMFADGSTWNEKIHAIGPAGMLECRVPGPQRFWPEDVGPSPNPELEISPRNPKRPQTVQIELDEALVEAGDHHGSTFFQHQKFLEMIHFGGRPDVTLEDGLRSVLMGINAQRAALERRTVTFDGLGIDIPA